MHTALENVHIEEVTFAGDGVKLAGQIDYPNVRCPSEGYPLLFILHHAGYDTRDAYRHYVRLGNTQGFAVFSWDKRGTGRSGACGKGSTTRDALHAYRAALSQPFVNPERVVIIAVGAGTTMLGASFAQFARLQRPCGVVLAGNMLDPQAIKAIDSQVQIIIGENDWTPWQVFGKGVADAHNSAHPHGASYYVAECCDRALMDTRQKTPTFNENAGELIGNWLKRHSC
jgi:hypothetical protein